MPERVHSARRGSAALAAACVSALAVLLGGCSSGPTVTVRNGAATPLTVAFWTSERVGSYEQTWKDMQGQSDRVDPGKSKTYRLVAYREAADPVLRMQVLTRGPSWEPAYTFWFEILTSPPLTITLTGPADRIEATPNRGLVAPIPWERVPAERRTTELVPRASPPAGPGKK